jgi:molybdopterin biosynthesis enzyme
VLGRALVARLTGGAVSDAVSSSKLARKVTSTIGIAEFVPLRISEEGAAPLGSGFLSLRSLAQADGWMLVPAESEGYPAGYSVTVRPLP